MMPQKVARRKTLARWTRLSLRSKGVVVLTIPLSALVIAQFALYQVEGDVVGHDRQVVSFYETRSALTQLRVSLSSAQADAAAYAAGEEKPFAAAFDEARESVNQALKRLSPESGSAVSEGALAEIRRQVDQEISILNTVR